MDFHAADLFTNFLVVVGTLISVSLICHAIKLPTIAGFLLAGIVTGPNSLALVNSVPNVEMMAEMSAIFLMFTIGLEFSFKKILQMRKILIGLGLGQVLLTTLTTSFILNEFLHLPIGKAFFIGMLVSMSSTAVVLKLLEENRELQSPFGQASLGILLFQDLAIIPLLVLMPTLSGQIEIHESLNIQKTILSLIEGIVIVGIILIGSRFFVPYFLERVVQTKSKEMFFFSILFICVGTALGMANVGLSLAFGAFFAGLMISESPFARQAVSDFIPFRNNFLGLFFVAVGMLVDPIFIYNNFTNFFMLTITMFALKFACLFFVLWLFGNSSSLSIITSVLLLQTGEFSLILALKGIKIDLLSIEESHYFVAASVVSLALTPIVYRLAPIFAYRTKIQKLIPRPLQEIATQLRDSIMREPLKINLKSQAKLNHAQQITGHTIIVGFGLTGQNVAMTLKQLSIPYKIVDLNNETVKHYASLQEPIIWGDAVTSEILHSLHIETARLVIVCTNDIRSSDAILRSIRRHRPDIQVILRIQFYRDLEKIELSGSSEAVVAEYETTLEVLNRCLHSYGVSTKQIYQFSLETRRKLKDSGQQVFSPRLDLPAWDIIANIRPLTLEPGSLAVGKSLTDIDLRRQFGVYVVSLYRPNLGATVPDPDLVLSDNDILYLLGSPDAIDSAENFLTPKID